MINSNQSIGLKKEKTTRTYEFTKKEFDIKKVPTYAYDMQEQKDTISFKCTYDAKHFKHL